MQNSAICSTDPSTGSDSLAISIDVQSDVFNNNNNRIIENIRQNRHLRNESI